MLPEREQLDRIFADDPARRDDIADVDEFEDYMPVVVCACIIIMIVVFITLAILSIVDAPQWVSLAIMLFYATCPAGMLMIWGWRKPAVRVPSGMVLGQRQFRLYIAAGWFVWVAFLVMRMAWH